MMHESKPLAPRYAWKFDARDGFVVAGCWEYPAGYLWAEKMTLVEFDDFARRHDLERAVVDRVHMAASE